jgi:hypothetical protein
MSQEKKEQPAQKKPADKDPMKKDRFGRPTKYCEEILHLAQEYINKPFFETVTKDVPTKNGIETVAYERPNGIPSIAGLAVCLKVSRETIYRWSEKHSDFCDTLEELKVKQKEFLLYHGLTKGYDSSFAKFVSVNMTDMSDKKEVETNAQPISVTIKKDE